MKKIILLLFLSVSTIGLSAQSWDDGKDDTFLWKVSDADSHLYLLGSVHVADSTFYPLDSEIMEAYSYSDGVVVEILNMDVDQGMILLRMQAADGRKLSDKLSKENYEYVVRELSKVGMPPEMIDQLKPWAAGLTLMQLEIAGNGLDPSLGIDKYFIDKAKDDEKELDELESVMMQIGLLDSLDSNPDGIIDYFTKEADNYEGDMLMKLVNSWKTGKESEMSALLMESMGDDENAERFKELFITKRNIGMADKIKGYLKENKTYFVIAGTAHYVGEGSVVELLNETGEYSIKKY
ncbi:MAG: TraB/GumN family protein [Candidatus Kapaibacteriales bacterium]